jgi:hypothetical protein
MRQCQLLPFLADTCLKKARCSQNVRDVAVTCNSTANRSMYLISTLSVPRQTTLPGSSPGSFAFRFTISTGVSCRSSGTISRRCFSFTFSRIQKLYTTKSTKVTPALHPVTLRPVSRHIQPDNKGNLHCSDLGSDTKDTLLRGFDLCDTRIRILKLPYKIELGQVRLTYIDDRG